ncbi:MAG: hypothetical protein JW929_13915 [Anaerolineales bacterium]|nr:hypothetical protein [Anaerolineales bacterium]
MRFLSRLRSLPVPIFLLGLASCNPLSTPPPTATPAPSATPTSTAAATAPQLLPPGDYGRTVDVDGVKRFYLLHVPPGSDALGPVPAVFVFHGWSGTPKEVQGSTDFNYVADRNGFIAVYPQGTGTGKGDLSWNAGDCCGAALAADTDEPAFVRRMLADLETLVRIDPKRTYAAGFSNGAFLSYRLACEMSETFAAVAPVGGVLVFEPCLPQQPVAVIHVHGLYDRTVPYEGGGVVVSGGFPSVEETIHTWVGLDGCDPSPLVDEPFRNVTHTAYGSCRAGTAVERYAIDLYGHRWPTANVFPASQTIWDFFAAHPKP